MKVGYRALRPRGAQNQVALVTAASSSIEAPGGMTETAIDFEVDGTINVGKSQLLFEDSLYERFRGLTNYDVDSDGRFLMVKGSAPTHINVILNWS